MRNVWRNLGCAILFMWVGQNATLAQQMAKAQFSISDYGRYSGECSLAGYRTYSGAVESLTIEDTGSLIRLKTTEIRDHQRQKSAKEKPPHSGAEAYTARDTPGDPMYWSWSRKTSGVVSFHWRKEDGLVPVAPGMNCEITVDKNENPVDITYEAAITHWRKRDNGFVEVVLAAEAGEKSKITRLLYLRPTRMEADACAMDIHWTKKWGLLVTVDAAGPGDIEAEAPRKVNVSLPLANSSEVKIVPGRDGWQMLPSLKVYNVTEGAKDPKAAKGAEKSWENIQKAIPKAQFMQGAG